MRESSEDLRPQPQRSRRCRMRPVKKGTGFFLLIFKRGESVMVFSSASFLIFFLPCLLVLYFLVPRRCRYLRNLILLAFSLAFYACGGPKFLLLMLLSIVINYVGGLLAGPAHRAGTRRLGMTLAVVLGLALLGWFKYAGFFGEMLHALLPVVPVPQVTLPIGISFFTFQGLSYVIDVYRGDAAVQRDPLKLALYIAFFPQLVAGPIVRYTTVAEEIDERHESVSEFSAGAVRFLFGLGKKMLLANAVARIADAAFAAVMPSVLFAWLGAVAYTFQIYFDFSAYSDMAIGLGRMFGFHFLENFNYPYVARSVTEFWRRWHISLSTWFRDYVYIPLGGNRVSKTKWLRNILVVWLLTGLWHGAAWNFVLWGLFFAVFLTAEKLWYGRALAKTRVFKHIYVLLLVVVSFVLFDANSVGEAAAAIGGLFGAAGVSAVNPISLYYLRSFAVVFLIGIVGATPLPKRIVEQLGSTRAGAMVVDVLEPLVLVSVLAVSTGYLVDGSFNPFLYFRF